MKKNDTFTAVCEGYTEDGSGVVRNDGFVFFVPGLILGEKAEIGINALKKNYGYGRIITILEKSEHRIEPKCSVSRLCGGCQLQHMDDAAQREFKEEKVRMCFRQNAGIEPQIDPIVKAEPYWNYRNKVQIPVQVNKGRTEIGFYQNHTNKVIPYEQCEVQTELSNEMSLTLRSLFVKYRCSESIRHILIKHAHVSGEVMLCLVVREYPFAGSQEIFETIQKKYPQIASLSVIVNRREDNVILDGKEILIAGRPYITEELLGCRFRIHARSFFQINPYTTRKLYSTAIDYAGLTGKETLIDLYCGTGTIGILAAKKAKKVYGIEIVADAVRDAKRNAQENGIENIDFYNMDAGHGAQAIIRSKIKADVVIVDPPRKGCSRDTLDAILTIAPQRLVYVSCDPATLARDVRILMDHGYMPEKITPFDMFPQSVHIETIVLLQKLNS